MWYFSIKVYGAPSYEIFIQAAEQDKQAAWEKAKHYCNFAGFTITGQKHAIYINDATPGGHIS